MLDLALLLLLHLVVKEQVRDDAFLNFCRICRVFLLITLLSLLVIFTLLGLVFEVEKLEAFLDAARRDASYHESWRIVDVWVESFLQ